jgi:cytoskeletal protein CcmA (bactofilin family)
MSLFGKTPDSKPEGAPGAAPAPKPAAPAPTPATTSGKSVPTAAASASSVCVIGAKTVIKGEIMGDEDVLIEGKVEGQIRISRDVRVGASGSVKATIEAQSVVVSGEVIGDCSASSRVEIQASGKLTGNIRAPKIVIAEGALFKGNSDMSAGRKEPPKAATY